MGQGIDVRTQWDTLRDKCPRLYRQRIAIECGPGWYDILYGLSMKIERILEELSTLYGAIEGEENAIIEMFAVQVKEKYGTLRFYMSSETDEIGDLIAEAEALSSQICESCGAPGKMRGACWMEVRCDQCFKGKK